MVVSEPLTRRLWLEQSFTGIIPSNILEDIDVSSACKWWSERQVSASTDLWLMIRRRNNEQDDGWVRRSNSETILPNLWPGLMTHEELPSSRTRKLLEYLNTFYTPNERRNLFTRVETCHWGLAVQWLNGFFLSLPKKVWILGNFPYLEISHFFPMMAVCVRLIPLRKRGMACKDSKWRGWLVFLHTNRPVKEATVWLRAHFISKKTSFFKGENLYHRTRLQNKITEIKYTVLKSRISFYVVVLVWQVVVGWKMMAEHIRSCFLTTFMILAFLSSIFSKSFWWLSR